MKSPHSQHATTSTSRASNRAYWYSINYHSYSYISLDPVTGLIRSLVLRSRQAQGYGKIGVLDTAQWQTSPSTMQARGHAHLGAACGPDTLSLVRQFHGHGPSDLSTGRSGEAKKPVCATKCELAFSLVTPAKQTPNKHSDRKRNL